MQIGIRLHDTAPGSLRERLATARMQGFRCAHIALSKTVEGFRMSEAPRRLTDDFADQFRAILKESGLSCALLGCYQQLAEKDGETLEKTQACYRAHLRFARLSGVKLVGTETPGRQFSFRQRQSEDALRLFEDGLRPVLRYAEEQDVLLGVEPVFCDIVSTPERAERLLDDMRSDHLRIILDGVNLLSNEGAKDPAPIIGDAIRRLGDRVALLHMKDFRLVPGEERPVPVACGLGSMRFDTLLAFVRRQDLPMTLENTAPENASAAREYLERLAGELKDA